MKTIPGRILLEDLQSPGIILDFSHSAGKDYAKGRFFIKKEKEKEKEKKRKEN